MPSAIAAAAKHIQDLKAQSLATLMASIDPVQALAKLGGNATGSAQAALQSAEAAIRAVIIETQPNGRATLQIAGGLIEAQLPPELLRAAATNPNLLRPGAQILLPANTPARPLPGPATTVALTNPISGSSVGPAPQLVNAFPVGTLGAVVAKLAGIAFPASEPEASNTLATTLPHTAPALRPGMLSHAISPEIAEALLRGAGRQMPLASAISQILAGAGDTTLAPELAAAVRALLGARATPETLSNAASLRQAIAQSGLFLEANLAQGAGGRTPADLKAILLAIRALTGGDKLAANPERAGLGATPDLHAPRAAADAARLPELARAAEGALERVKLMQLASLPNHPEITVTDDRAQPMRIALQIPLATQGMDRAQTAMMGLMIEHRPLVAEAERYTIDDQEGDKDATPFPWKIRVALDLEETGPVQAEIGLRGQSVSVTLWAERQSMARMARDGIGSLHEALTEAAFDVIKLEVKDGRPQGKFIHRPNSPHLDRRT